MSRVHTMEIPSEILYNSRLVRRASRNLFKRLRWCYFIGNLVCDLPNDPLRKTTPSLLKSIICGARLLFIVSVTILFFYKTPFSKDRFFFQSPYTLASFLYLMLGFELNYRHATFRNNSLEVLKSLIQFDVSYVQYVDENYTDKRTYGNRTMLAIFFLFSVAISNIIIFAEATAIGWLLWVPKVIGRVSAAWCCFNIIIHAMEIKQRYDNLNSHLQNIDNNEETSIYIDLHKIDNSTNKLYYINRLHYKLHSIVNCIFDMYNIPLFVISTASICHLVTDLYYLYKVMFLQIDDISKAYAVLHGFRMVTLMLEIVALVLACSGVCESANITPVLLHQYRNDYFNIKVDPHIQMYSLQHLHQKVYITVIGFYDVDLSVLYTIVGVVVTYLIVIIQFDKASEMNMTKIN